MDRLRHLWLRLRRLAARRTSEDEMQAEMRDHLDLATARFMSSGLLPHAARIAARREFGNSTMIEEDARDARGWRWIGFSWMDLRVALRRLRKHPALNLAAIVALAVGIPVGLAPSHLARALTAPLPSDAGDRLRAIRYWDPLSSGLAPTWDADFTFWTQNLHRFAELGAFRTSSENVTPTGTATGSSAPAVPTAGAQVSLSVFTMLRVRPMLGRVFNANDFAVGAPDVVVIGRGLWSSRFGSDPAVLGRSLRIGRALHVVVGVMPDGFAFPSNEAFWVPLRLAPIGGVGNFGEHVRVQVLGRLADGTSALQAQAELSSQVIPLLTGVAGAAAAQERARLRAEVVPFGLLYLGLPAGGFAALPEYRYVQVLALALLLVACGNVAMLVFARTATRLQELAIRTALGASRTRLVSQVFVETLVLSVLAAGAGLLIVQWALGRVNLAAVAGEVALPYWLSLGVTRQTVLSAIGLAAVSATVAGVVPAIAITGRIAHNIRGGSRVRFGRLTGGLVVADIAMSVALVGMALAVSGHATDLQAANRATGIAASEYLAVEFRLPDATRASQGAAANAALQRDLVAALEQEPGIRRVAVGDALPRMEHRSRPYELEGAGRTPDVLRRWTRVARVDVTYFDALGTPILSGRDFQRSDVEAGGNATRVAIVNTAFVERALEGRDPIGRRVRFPTQSNIDRADEAGNAGWYEIVGVVGPLGVNVMNADRGEAVYLPAASGTINPMQLAVHAANAGASPAGLTARVRARAMQVDPNLVMGKTAVLSDVRQGDWYLTMGVVAGLLVLVGVLIALVTSGLYAMLSLAVSERTREIGIRAALGAPRRAQLTAILRRSLVQIGLGAGIGLPIAARFAFELAAIPDGGGSVVQSLAVALGLTAGIVLVVGLGSCLMPARRILAVQASEAMRAEG